VPLTAKLRLGWDEDNLNYREIAEIAVANGARMIALHGRTAKMAYSGKARWQPMAELKASYRARDWQRRRSHYRSGAPAAGADRLRRSHGRARGQSQPFLFSWRDREDISPAEYYGLMRYQLEEMRPFHPISPLLPFRKFLKAYHEPYALPTAQLRAMLTAKEDKQTNHIN
jgi:hypothetical protein